jgi:hypothetical protein
MQKQQLELTFDRQPTCRPLAHKSNRFTRARWWFDQMHRVVDSALDWQPAPPARPEQECLVLPRGSR